MENEIERDLSLEYIRWVYTRYGKHVSGGGIITGRGAYNRERALM